VPRGPGPLGAEGIGGGDGGDDEAGIGAIHAHMRKVVCSVVALGAVDEDGTPGRVRNAEGACDRRGAEVESPRGAERIHLVIEDSRGSLIRLRKTVDDVRREGEIELSVPRLPSQRSLEERLPLKAPGDGDELWKRACYDWPADYGRSTLMNSNCPERVAIVADLAGMGCDVATGQDIFARGSSTGRPFRPNRDPCARCSAVELSGIDTTRAGVGQSIRIRDTVIEIRVVADRSPGCAVGRGYLAGQLYGLRSRLHRSGGKNSAASRQPFWPKSVTYVAGTFCYPCLRAGPRSYGAGDGNRTHVRNLGKMNTLQAHTRGPHP